MAWKKELALACCAWAFGISPAAHALPVLDAKDAAVRIETAGKAMNITGGAQHNVIRWVDFSVAGGETVAFDGKDYLNYVTGKAPSEIFGTLTGGGNIYIINPNGILIGDGAEVNVGNLYLSTRNLSDEQIADFAAGGASPISNGADANGNIVNLGHLEATAVVVEGNVIKFKNVEDVTASTINAFAKTETRVGYDEGRVNPNTYANLSTAKWYKLIGSTSELKDVRLDDNHCRYMLAGNLKVDEDFTAIGTYAAHKYFLGHLDGLGYGITFTKRIKAKGMTTGLFGAIGEGSVVENVTVKTGDMEAPEVDPDDIGYIGGIVSYNNKGTIRNVCHTGSISVSKNRKYYVGGIAGYNEGGRIEKACNMGNISVSGGGGSHVGGIVGYNYSGGKVNDAYNVCDIPDVIGIQSDMFGGGIAGGNRGGSIENVYNLASVSGVWAGGIVGKSYGNAASISYGYHALGDIRGSVKVGGIVGGFENTVSEKQVEHVFCANAHIIGNTVNEVTELTGEGVDWWQRAGTFENDGWSISAEGGANTTWRICDGYSMLLLAAFLKPKYNSSIVEYDGTRPAGTYRSRLSFSKQLEGFKQGCDYISDLTWVLPKDEPTETKPIDANRPVDSPKPEPSGDETIAAGYPVGKEYENEIVALQHPKTEEQRAVSTSAESEAEKLVVVGSGVHLPDSMSAEDFEAMLSETGAKENT